MPGSPDARRERSTAAASGGRTDGASQKLAERLHEIAAQAPAPEDALEPALRAVLEACGATAGAICLFDQRNEMLRLAAEVGLSDEGCRQLRSVRRGGMGTWDMPLHSLLNRRAYLIESAARNRYVPPLVEPAASVRTLACVPLYAGSTPLASLILVAMIPASFSERDIRVLDQAIRELVKMIEAVRRRAPGQSSALEPDAPAPPPLPSPAAPTTTRTHARATLSPELSPTAPPHTAAPPADAPPVTAADSATTEVLATALAESEHERTRLATALDQALGRSGGMPPGNDDELARATQALETAEAAHAAAAAEAEAARVEATRCRVEIQRLETSDREHVDERARLEQALAAATARTDDDGTTRARLDAELTEARTQLGRLAELEHERDALALERDRLREAAASAGEAEAARAELAHAR
ncbi:MAG TPA: GAF domain-containing protein, partial [Candidatus Binatia bacterium]|nr:GAF domain-containing protein [Candidatus Binatia bacterium]